MYSFGQIRLLLQQFAPGVSLDTIDQAINARYGLMLSLMEWKGLEASGVLETTAAICTGTITATQGSNAVVGVATGWTTSITGMQLLVDGTSPLYTVTFASATSLTLDRPFEGASITAGGYTLLQSVYPLPANCRTLSVITSPTTGLELTPMTELEFAQLVGFGDIRGVATRYIPQPDLVDPSTGSVLAQQIKLYPLPTQALGYPIVYEQSAPAFDGVNTNAGPLPFVSDAALLDGCRASLLMQAKDYAGAQVFEAAFHAHFTGMIHVENTKREPRAPRLDPAYTRHRIQRVLRGFGGITILNDGF